MIPLIQTLSLMKSHKKITSHELDLFRGIADCKYPKLLETYTKFHHQIQIVPQIIDPIWVARKAVYEFANTTLRMNADDTLRRVDTITEMYWKEKEAH